MMDTKSLGLILGFTTFLYLVCLAAAGFVYYFCIKRTGKHNVSVAPTQPPTKEEPYPSDTLDHNAPDHSAPDHNTGTLNVSMIPSIATEEEMSYSSIARMRSISDCDPSYSHYQNNGNGYQSIGVGIGGGLEDTTGTEARDLDTNTADFYDEQDTEPIYSKPDLSKKNSVKANSVTIQDGGGNDQDGGESHGHGLSRDRLPSSPLSPVPPALPPRPDSFILDDTLP